MLLRTVSLPACLGGSTTQLVCWRGRRAESPRPSPPLRYVSYHFEPVTLFAYLLMVLLLASLSVSL